MPKQIPFHPSAIVSHKEITALTAKEFPLAKGELLRQPRR